MFTFFSHSDLFDHIAIRPLAHIRGNWELSWDNVKGQYVEEEDSYANIVNELLYELEKCDPPKAYHDNEDILAEYVKAHLKWKIKKEGNRWVGMDYESILEQGGFHDIDEANLILAAAGRIHAAKIRGQNHFDEMEESHQRMLAAVISIILYHHSNYTK